MVSCLLTSQNEGPLEYNDRKINRKLQETNQLLSNTSDSLFLYRKYTDPLESLDKFSELSFQILISLPNTDAL